MCPAWCQQAVKLSRHPPEHVHSPHHIISGSGQYLLKHPKPEVRKGGNTRANIAEWSVCTVLYCDLGQSLSILSGEDHLTGCSSVKIMSSIKLLQPDKLYWLPDYYSVVLDHLQTVNHHFCLGKSRLAPNFLQLLSKPMIAMWFIWFHFSLSLNINQTLIVQLQRRPFRIFIIGDHHQKIKDRKVKL